MILNETFFIRKIQPLIYGLSNIFSEKIDKLNIHRHIIQKKIKKLCN